MGDFVEWINENMPVTATLLMMSGLIGFGSLMVAVLYNSLHYLGLTEVVIGMTGIWVMTLLYAVRKYRKEKKK